MTNSSTKTDPWIGRTIAGEFLILKRIGAGGMGSVYLAEQVGMDREVVVKVILANLSHDTDVVTRFRREAKTIARLRHPNIVQVFTSGETDDGGLYLAMEYVPGRTLGQELKRSETMVDDRIVHIAKQIAAALAAAHAANIVHRDLKPANVILTAHPGNPDHVIVLDFGIAKVLEEPRGQTKLTQTGWMMGTPAYMAPEQIASRPVDGRTDIYTLGVMLYEMATGANPFDAETPIECMMKHLNEPVTPTHERFPELGVSPALEACIQQCLEKSPADRFATAEALLERLRAIESRTAPIRYAPPSGLPAKSGPRRVLVVTAICLALIAAGAAFFSLSNRDERVVVTDAASPERTAEGTAESPGTQQTAGTSSAATLASSADPTAAGPSANPESTLTEPGSDAEATDEPKPPRSTPSVASRYPTPQPGSVYRQPTNPNPVGYRPTGQQVAATPPAYPRQPVVRPSQTPPIQRPPVQQPTVQQPSVQQPTVERPDPAPVAEPQPEAEPVLESDGPFGSPLISDARMESQLGSMAHYRSRVPFEEVMELYEDEFRDSRVMMARHGEGLEEYLAIMDSRDEFGFNMIRIQPEADGTTKLIFFSD